MKSSEMKARENVRQTLGFAEKTSEVKARELFAQLIGLANVHSSGVSAKTEEGNQLDANRSIAGKSEKRRLQRELLRVFQGKACPKCNEIQNSVRRGLLGPTWE